MPERGDARASGTLLDEGNRALLTWSAEVAKYVGDVLSLRPEASFADAAGQFPISAVATHAAPRLGDFYRQLVIGAFAHARDDKKMAAEVAGILESFVSQGPGQPAETYIRSAKERIGDGDAMNVDLVSLIEHDMEEVTALSLWADERVREGSARRRTARQACDAASSRHALTRGSVRPVARPWS